MQDEVPLSPIPESMCPPAFVLGGREDALVDIDAINETARYLYTSPVIIEGMGHDCMLDTSWLVAAQELLTFARDPAAFRTALASREC